MRLHSKESEMNRGLRVWTLTIIGGLLALLMLAAVACEDGSQPTGTSEPTPTPTSSPRSPAGPSPTPAPIHPALEAAIAAMRNVDSFHFVESSSRDVPEFGGEATFEASGDYQSPDRLYRRALVRNFGSLGEDHLQAISIGNTRYMTDPNTREWARSVDSLWSTELFRNPIDFFEGAASGLGRDAYRGVSKLDGVKVHRFVSDILDHGRTNVIQSSYVVIVVGVDDSLVREVRSSSSWSQRPCSPDQACPAIKITPGWADYTVKFSYPDEVVTIQAPQIHIDKPTQTPTPTPPAGICDRTEQVRDAILKRIDGVDDCKALTAAHLSTIDGEMVLAGMDIGELQPGDFAGLTALDALDIRGSGLTSLEAGVFDGLSSLTVLDLRGNWYNAYPDWLGSAHWNRLASLEKEVFAGLTSLRELYLGVGNRLTALEVGLFDDLRSLEKLDLSGNDVNSLEAGLFDSLDSLKYLYISGNPLTSLEGGVFDNLASLRELKMSYAGETAPPKGLFAKLTLLRELSMGTSIASLEAGVLVGIPITRLSVSLYVATLPGESSRGLTTLPGGLFHGLTSVKVLDFSGQFLIRS